MLKLIKNTFVMLGYLKLDISQIFTDYLYTKDHKGQYSMSGVGGNAGKATKSNGKVRSGIQAEM